MQITRRASGILASKYGSFLLTTIAFFLPPFFIEDQYVLHILIMSEIWVILSLSMNLLMGYAGQVSMAHGAIYGIGAYTSALLCLHFGISFWVSLPLATLLSMIFGFLIGLPSFRATGIYFVILTMGFGLVFYDIFNNWMEVTKGPLGLKNIPVPGFFFGFNFASKQAYYYLVFAFMVFSMYLMQRLNDSTWGEAFLAIREDEVLAKSMGINLWKHKTIAMTISCGITGLAGVLYAHYINFIDPISFGLLPCINMIIMPVVGSMGTFIGPILGATILVIVPEALRVATEFREVIYGFMLLLFLLFMPRGIIVFIQEKISRR